MARDVFHHHDRVVDQNADREDQREQADAVDGVAHQIGGKQRQQDRGGDHHQRHQRFAPADRHRDQHHDRDGGDAEMQQQLVGFFVGGLAIVARHGDLNVGRDQPALQGVEALRDFFGHHHGVGTGALGERHAHRGHTLPLPLGVRRFIPHPALDRVGTDHHRGHVLDIDRAAIARGDQQHADIGNAGQRLTRRDAAHRAGITHRPGQERAIGVLHLGNELLQRDAEQRQLFGVGLDPDLLRGAAGDIGQADTIDLHQFGAQLVGKLEQILVGPAIGDLGPRRQRQHRDRDVVDAAADDQRLGDADRNPIVIGAHLFVHAQDRVLGSGADQEARRHQHAVVLGLAIDVFDAVDRFDDRLQRLGHEFNRVGAAQTVGVDANIDHRHADLRFFFARDQHQSHQADRERRQQEQRRHRRADGGAGQFSRQSKFHGRTSSSPARTPDRISMPSGCSALGSGRPRCTGTLAIAPLRLSCT